MTRTHLPYTYAKSKKLASGKWRDYWFFRREGTHASLHGSPGEAVFHARYAELMAREEAVAANSRPKAVHTFDWLMDEYLASAEYGALADATQTDYRRTIERIRPFLGPERYDCITRGAVKLVRDKFRAQPRTAHKIKQMVSRIYTWADESDLVEEGFNPAAKLKRIKARTNPITIWSDEEIALFLAHAEEPARTIAMLALYTGQRRGDLATMDWRDVVGGTIRVRQNKTGEPLDIGYHKTLRAHLSGQRTRFGGPIIRTRDGKQMDANAISSAMNRAVAAVPGMPHRTLHGLRYAAAGMLEEAGCSVVQITSVLGHRTYQMALKYMSQRKAAQAAISKMEGLAG